MYKIEKEYGDFKRFMSIMNNKGKVIVVIFTNKCNIKSYKITYL